MTKHNIKKINVNLGSRSYEIITGTNLLEISGRLILPLLKQKKTFIVTDENVAPIYLEKLTSSLKEHGVSYNSIVFPAGEHTKSFGFLEKALDAMLEAKCERSTTVIALGGGVIGDLTGFAASALLRGVDFIQIPTTLLSQVDSSVGGKTGINCSFGKNLIGAFHQPKLVIADIKTLDTLDERQMKAGFAEVVKYGLINRPDFWGWLEDNAEEILNGDRKKQHKLWQHMVVESCKSKAAIVEEDEKEKGVRALLNLGHTFSHAIEAESNYEVLHGEGVAIGLVMAAMLSCRKNFCSKEDVDRIIKLLMNSGMITVSNGEKVWETEKLFAHMQQDKKVKDSKINFVLLKGIGKAFLENQISRTEILETMETFLEQYRLK